VSDQAKADKPKPDQKKYLAVQFFSNLIGVVVVVAFLAWIVFGLFGPGSGTLIEVRAFALLFLLCFVLIQCHGAVINTRRDFIRGRWVMGDPAGREPDGVFNPWRRIGPLALPAGVAVSLAAWFLVPLTGDESFKLFTIDTIVFVPLLLGTTVLIAVILPRDQVCFVHALRERSAGAVPGFGAYFVIEHLLPWAVIQGLINMGIGLKQFKWVLEGPEQAEVISVRLGRLTPKQFRASRLGRVGLPVIAVGVILTTVLAMIAVGSIMQWLLPVAGLDELSIETAVALKTLGALLGTLAGCGVGVWWGRRKESALMEA